MAFRLFFFTLSVWLVTAMPGKRAIEETMCDMTADGCLSALQLGDFDSPQNMTRICTSTQPQFVQCVDRIPEHCSASVVKLGLDQILSYLNTLCGAGGCGLTDMEPCATLLTQIESGGTLCSVKEPFLTCDRNLPDACRSDSNYQMMLAPARTWLESLSC
ncbi:uncharacterized protein LOC132563845 [Ylistrum balloti]|uniref:uncharacterized protein LOC132563845 n=1 Tax=Ylistrum balloti TaxID=509963 RepID=UPI002905E846|nr:uncharacterized protein LOC132563845 [Ylistrum balloti]